MFVTHFYIGNGALTACENFYRISRNGSRLGNGSLDCGALLQIVVPHGHESFLIFKTSNFPDADFLALSIGYHRFSKMFLFG